MAPIVRLRPRYRARWGTHPSKEAITAKKDVGEMKRAAGFQNEFWTMFVGEYERLNGSSEQLYALDQDGLRRAAQADALDLLQTGRNREQLSR